MAAIGGTGPHLRIVDRDRGHVAELLQETEKPINRCGRASGRWIPPHAAAVLWSASAAQRTVRVAADVCMHACMQLYSHISIDQFSVAPTKFRYCAVSAFLIIIIIILIIVRFRLTFISSSSDGVNGRRSSELDMCTTPISSRACVRCDPTVVRFSSKPKHSNSCERLRSAEAFRGGRRTQHRAQQQKLARANQHCSSSCNVHCRSASKDVQLGRLLPV